MHNPENYKALIKAIEDDDTKKALACLPFVDLGQNGNEPLLHAVRCDRVDIVKHIIQLVDARYGESIALFLAAKNGQYDMVRLLLPHSDPKANASQALSAAVKEGHLSVVNLLIPVSDPKANGSFALKSAVLYNNQAMIDALAPVSDVKQVLKHFKGEVVLIFPGLVYLKELIENQKKIASDKKTLKSALEKSKKSKPKSFSKKM